MRPAPSHLRMGLVCLVLFAGTLALFSRVLGHEFTSYDDPHYVTKNEHVHAGLSGESVCWAFGAGLGANWHPLTWMSHMLDWQLFGANPHGHHATSVIWHALNAVVVFLLMCRLTGGFWSAAFSAALFASHPLRVESVAWVAERKDVLSGFFGLLCLWAYAVYAQNLREQPARASRYYWLALVAFGLGLMAKPMLVTLPCVLLLLDSWPFRRVAISAGGAGTPLQFESRCVPMEKIPFFLLAAASCVATFLVQKHGGAMSSISLGLADRAANAVVSIARYLGKFFWPSDLAVIYPHPGFWPWWTVAGAVLLVLMIALVVWQQRYRHPWLLTGWLWFVGMLIPVIGLVQVGFQSMADRYTYLPILGLQLALIGTWRELPFLRSRWIALLVAGAVLAGCAARTWAQLGVWRDSETLFKHAIAVTDKNYIAHNKLGMVYVRERRLEEALPHFERALEFHPGDPDVCSNLGSALDEMGRLSEAILRYEQSLRLQPDSAEVCINLANALVRTSRAEQALPYFERALQLNPKQVEAHGSFGYALAGLGRFPEAIQHLERALSLRPPGSVEAHCDVAKWLLQTGKVEEALRHYEQAVQINPGLVEAHGMMGNIFSNTNRLEQAVVQYREVIRLQPDLAEAHNDLGVALIRSGKTAEAEAEFLHALQLKPDYRDAKTNLGRLRSMKARSRLKP